MVKREELWFDSRDEQHKIHAVRWIPAGEIKCILQLIHGMAEHIERYDAFARNMAERGVLVVANDHLGHGKSVVSKEEYGYFCEKNPLTVVIRDVHRLKKLTQEAYPGLKYFIFGHSMGSMLLRNYLFRYGNGIDGALICGTAYQPPIKTAPGIAVLKLMTAWKGEKYKSRFASNLVNGTPNARIRPPRTEFDWLTKDNDIVDAYIEDEACGFLFTLNGYLTLVESVRRQNKKQYLESMPKDLPILFLAGEEDPVGSYGEGVRRSYQMFLDVGMKQVGIRLYPGARHEILNDSCKKEVYEDVFSFMEQNMK